jgi:hypothetical protein
MTLLRRMLVVDEAEATKAGAAKAKAATALSGATTDVSAEAGATELLEAIPAASATCITDKVWGLDAQPKNWARLRIKSWSLSWCYMH